MRKVSYLFLVVTFMSSCDGFFEKDLSKSEIEIVIPSDNYVSTIRNVHFKWVEIKGAEGYRLEIMSPGFNNPQFIILDSLIESDEFYFSLDPGMYEWRIRGENRSSHTAYSEIRTIQIDSTNDLSGQSLLLQAPANNAYINKPNPTLYWEELDISDYYEIVVVEGTDWITGTLVSIDTAYSNLLTLSTALSEGEYLWGVRAINSVSSTDFFIRGIRIDLTVPSPPVLIDPTDGQAINSGTPFTFSWNRAADAGVITSPMYDSVYIYTDPGFTNLFKRFKTTSQDYLDSISIPDTYYWRVKTLDEAGNSGPFSNYFTFDIQ